MKSNNKKVCIVCEIENCIHYKKGNCMRGEILISRPLKPTGEQPMCYDYADSNTIND